MLTTPFETFADQSRRALQDAPHVVVPVTRRLGADLLTPVSAFLSLREGARFPFLFESVEGGEKLGRYSFLGRDPYRLLVARGRTTTILDLREDVPAGLPEAGEAGSVFDVLAEHLAAYDETDAPGLPRFTGGAVGFMGYDTVRLVERLPDAPPDDLGLPDAVWAFYDTAAAFDHVRRQLVLTASVFLERDDDLEAAHQDACARLDRLAQPLLAPRFDPPAPIRLSDDSIRSNTSRERFEAAVETAKRYVYEGDIFQVVLSQRFESTFEGDRFQLYRALRQVNPSPYLFYLDFEDADEALGLGDAFALVGSSPEVLVRVEDGQAEVLPIAGTRKRGADEKEDLALEEELLADPKERAEHLMLVDLGRNDLGRVCRFSSVEVARYAYVERYSHVMHIVSQVRGALEEGRSAAEVLAACFPAGTVSGAPKVRAMEIIDELEPTRRGPYAGAVGYASFSGDLDTCIAIRTMLARGGKAYVQAGAGIVADSDPDREFEETENKARALFAALRHAADGL